MPAISSIQQALKDAQVDGWLLYDFRANNPLARRILGMEGMKPMSRRFFYFIPAEGEPSKLVHRIEPGALDHLPGSKQIYLRWQELEAGVAALVGGRAKVAMEYSPRNANPYISRVDAGTLELVRSSGVEVVASGDLIQQFEATWDDEQWAMHQESAQICRDAYDVAFRLIADRVRHEGSVRETEVQRAILGHFKLAGAVTYAPPTVAVGPHSGDPHFDTSAANDAPIREGDFVLIDLWCRMDRPRAVYSDYTRVGYVGATVPERYEEVFGVIVRARDAAIALVREAFAANRPLRGREVDDACRAVVEAAGYGDAFGHRTGHNIGQEVHGNGAHIDDLETIDDRLIIPRTCFSIEPGIYLPEFGVRTEVDVYIAADRTVHVTGGEPQSRVLPILG